MKTEHKTTSASLAQNTMLADAVQEGNRLIAEFINLPIAFTNNIDLTVEPYTNNKVIVYRINNDWLTAGRLKYHSSWDWQIPIFGKIALAVKTLIPKLPNPESNGRWYFRNLDRYEKAIFNNQPHEGQKIIVELLKWHKDNVAEMKKVGIR